MAAFWATYAVAVFAKLSKQYLEALGHIEFEWKRKKSSILRLPDVFWNCREMIATVMHWFSPRIISLLYLSAWMCVCVKSSTQKWENEKMSEYVILILMASVSRWEAAQNACSTQNTAANYNGSSLINRILHPIRLVIQFSQWTLSFRNLFVSVCLRKWKAFCCIESLITLFDKN